MKVLWDLGTASVREVLEKLPENRRPAYTTVQTVIARLEEKGAVRQVKKISNAFIFEPVISRKAAQRSVVRDLLGMFGGSRPLMAHLAESGDITLEDLHEVEKLVEKRRKSRTKQ
jgi:predicted transcriptional regulator